jgi:hypothetical protein
MGMPSSEVIMGRIPGIWDERSQTSAGNHNEINASKRHDSLVGLD